MNLSHLPSASGIYLITHTGSGKRYVGSAKNVYARAHTHAAHLRKGTHHNRHLQSAWDAHGCDAFTIELIELVAVESSLLDREQVHIDRLDVCNREIGYNLVPLASRAVFSDETKARMSESMRGKIKSEQHRMRIAAARAKQDPASLSHPHTQETKDRIRALAKARPVPEGVGAKISAALTGRKRGPHTEEAKAKIAAKARARGPLSAAHRKKLSDASPKVRGHYSAQHGAAISAGKRRAFAERRAASA